MFNVKGVTKQQPSPSWSERRKKGGYQSRLRVSSPSLGSRDWTFLLSSGIRFVYCSTSPLLMLIFMILVAVLCSWVSSGKSFLKSLKNVEFHDREYFVYERIAGQLSCRCFCSEMLNVPPRGGEFLHG